LTLLNRTAHLHFDTYISLKSGFDSRLSLLSRITDMLFDW